MANKKQPLLKAVEHNWGLMGPGDWSEVRWRIFYDGSYEVISTFRPSSEDRASWLMMLFQNSVRQ